MSPARSFRELMGPNTALNETNPAFPSFVDLYDAHIDELYRFVHRRCRDHELTQDITQETFMTALRNHDVSEISIGWLKRVAGNRLIDALRRQSTYSAKLRLIGQSDDDASVSTVAERLRVEAALDRLRLEHRLVLTLHYIDGLTIGAMATELDRSLKSVEGLVTRARRELRELLEESDD
jgi:RNA polymerase sigma-70 factor (ECF subfamily)